MESKDISIVDEYISGFSEETQQRLLSVRKVIQEEAPGAGETISYMMPAYKLRKKALIYFAAFKDHISLYPTSSPVEKAIPEVSKYKTGKGTLQFKNNEELPLSLIRKVVRFRVEEIAAKSAKQV